MRGVWSRFIYAGSLLDAGFLPRRGLPRDYLGRDPLPRLQKVAGRAPDAFDTLMMVLHARLKS